jgi:hypothetical protein
MFETLDQLPPDPILGVTAAFRRDTSPLKVDLGVGVYRDEFGNTPVPAAVREAQAELRRAAALDARFHFQSLWHHLGYRYGFTVWNPLTSAFVEGSALSRASTGASFGPTSPDGQAWSGSK